MSISDLDILTDAVRCGERESQAFFAECLDLYKTSGAMDPELPLLLENAVRHLRDLALHQDPALSPDTPTGQLLQKVSSSPDFYDRVLPTLQDETPRTEKTSVVGDFLEGLLGGPAADARRAAASFGMPPRSGGALTHRDPLYDVTRDLRMLDPDSTEGIRHRAFTPEGRKALGVYFEKDLPALARAHEPQIRNEREAILAGTQAGVRRANTQPPGFIDSARLGILRRLAEHKAFRAQRSVLNPPFAGILGTLEESEPTWRDRASLWAEDMGSRLRHLHPGVKAALGLTAGGALTYGLHRALRRPPAVVIRRDEGQKKKEDMAP